MKRSPPFGGAGRGPGPLASVIHATKPKRPSVNSRILAPPLTCIEYRIIPHEPYNRRGPHSMIRLLAFPALAAFAALQGTLALWGFVHDAGRRDFGQFVSSAQLWREQGALYVNASRVNLNPPHASVLLFVPLTWMSFNAAVLLW